MDTLKVDQLLQLLASVSRAEQDYSTNLYADHEQLRCWSRQTPLRIEKSVAGAVLVIREDRMFNRVYHAAQNHNLLTSALAKLPADRYVSELVGREKALDQISTAYLKAGFRRHAFLCRMTRTSLSEVIKTAPDHHRAETPHATCIPAVTAFLERMLDPLTDQPPGSEELTVAVRDGRLLVVRRDESLAGILMYDCKGTGAHLRFWYVDPSVRGVGVGRALMAEFLARCGHLRRIILWVIGDNYRSQAIYRHYGFETDGLLDQIMVFDKDEMNEQSRGHSGTGQARP